MRATANLLLALLLLALILTACSPLPPEEEDPPVLPAVTGLVLRADGMDSVLVSSGIPSGFIPVVVDEETSQIAVTFIDDLDQEFTPESGFSFGASVGDGDIASVVGKTGWSFRLLGEDEGSTSVTLSVRYDGEAEYSSPAIPVQVTRVLNPFTWLAPDSLETLVTETPVAIEVAPLAGDLVTRVTFSVNGEALGEDTSAPFTAEWDPVRDAGPGIYGLEAMGFDAGGTPLAADTLYLMVPDFASPFIGTLGGAGDDRVYDMIMLEDGSVLLAGETTMPDGHIDGCLVRLAGDGLHGWYRAYGGSAGDHLRSLRATDDGGFIACGWTWRNPERAGPNFWLLKLDADGHVQWSRVHGEIEDYQYAHCVRPTADGGYIVAGSDASGSALSLIKTDASGDLQWRETYPGDGGGAGYAVEERDGGGYIVTGYRRMSWGDEHLWLIRTDAQGQQIWAEDYALDTPLSIGRAVLETGDGYAVLGGGGGDVWFLGVDGDGSEEWSRRYGGLGWDQGLSMIATSDGGYLLTGFTTPDIGNEKQLWLAKTDATGLLDGGWVREIGDAGHDEGHALVEVDGAYLVAGVTDSGATGGSDIRLFLVDLDGN